MVVPFPPSRLAESDNMGGIGCRMPPARNIYRMGSIEIMRAPTSINNIRTAIRELSIRADLAHTEGRHDDASEIEQTIQGYREELGSRP